MSALRSPPPPLSTVRRSDDDRPCRVRRATPDHARNQLDLVIRQARVIRTIGTMRRGVRGIDIMNGDLSAFSRQPSAFSPCGGRCPHYGLASRVSLVPHRLRLASNHATRRRPDRPGAKVARCLAGSAVRAIEPTAACGSIGGNSRKKGFEAAVGCKTACRKILEIAHPIW